MRLARADTPDGIVEGTFDGDIVEANGETYQIGVDATLLAPTDPGAIYTMGYNFESYIEMHLPDEEPPEPFGFSLKAPISIRASGETVSYPSFSSELGYSGELTAVIGEECRNVEEAEVAEVVKGYTIMNDLLAQDQEDIGTMKVFDGSAPVGPAISTDVDPLDLEMQTTVNGELRQEAHTSDMIQGPAEIIAELSRRCTLQPGDVIALGSPANPGTLEVGDEVEVWYEGVGTLTNTIGEPRV